MSLEERLINLESNVEETGSIEDIGECPLCVKTEYNHLMGYNRDNKPNLIQDIVKHVVLSKENLERCTKLSHEKLQWINPELDSIIKYFEGAIHTTSYFDYNRLMYGVCDIDDSKPRELIKLFSDYDIMEFVLKRHYDKTLAHVLKYGKQSNELTFYHELQLFKGPVDLTKLKISYENCLEILRQLDRVWLHSLNPDDYDTRPKSGDFNKRHLGFLFDNIRLNPESAERDKKEFDEWKFKAEQELGKKLTYKNFGDV